MKYLLDYGHGGNDPGAIGIDNIKEKDLVLEIGKRVKYHLERHQCRNNEDRRYPDSFLLFYIFLSR